MKRPRLLAMIALLCFVVSARYGAILLRATVAYNAPGMVESARAEATSASAFAARTLNISDNLNTTQAEKVLASAGSLIVTFPNKDIFLSPYVWRLPGDGSAVAPIGGAYIKGSVSRTSQILANVDTTLNSGLTASEMPTLKVTIDQEPAVFVQFDTNSTQVILASGLTPGSHDFRIDVIGGNQAANSSWSGTRGHTRITSLQFDRGATLRVPATYPKRCLFLGDSFVQGYFGGRYRRGTTAYYLFVDPSLTWPALTGPAINCEWGSAGIGGIGWLNPGQHGLFPAAPTWWSYLDSAHARDFSIPPDYLVVAWGINDHGANDSTLKAAIQSWLKSARALLPSTKIFIYIPAGGLAGDEDGTGGANAAPIRAAVRSQGDANVFLIDTGTDLVAANQWPYTTWFSRKDGLHPGGVAPHVVLASYAVQQIQKTSTMARVTPMVKAY